MYEYLVLDNNDYYKKGDIIVRDEPLSDDLRSLYRTISRFDSYVVGSIIAVLEHDVLEQYRVLHTLKTSYLMDDIEDYVITTNVIVGYVIKKSHIYSDISFVSITKDNIERISKRVQDIIDSLQARIKNLETKLKEIK